jgi:Protein of unknown function (DUF2283)
MATLNLLPRVIDMLGFPEMREHHATWHYEFSVASRYDKDGNIVGIEILNALKHMENPRTLECAVA